MARHLEVTPEFAAARSLALYAALPDELPTDAVVAAARRAGKRLLLPRAGRPDDAAPGALTFHAVEAWDQLRPGRYGVLEPPEGAPSEPSAALELVLVPGVAFDRAGGRLGRGMGWYDRTFPPGGGASGPRLFGLAFAFQLVPAVPAGERDRRVDALVTERGVLRCDRPGARGAEGGGE